MHTYKHTHTHTHTPTHHDCVCRLDTHTTSWTRLLASCREMSMANGQGETRERTSSPSADSNKFVNSLITHTHTHTHTDTHSHIHSLTHTTTHVQLCKELYADRLKSFEDITRVYDFDTFLREYRPKAADKDGHLQLQFRTDFEVRSDHGKDRVFTRSKCRLGDKTKFSLWVQMYPSMFDLLPHVPHHPSVEPPVADNKDWDNFETYVVPTLTRWRQTYTHTYHIHTTHTHIHDTCIHIHTYA